jgi:uncharacterized membrane protein (DUF4010 family)
VSSNLFVQMGIAVALGLLLGLQRERQGTRLAGIRTFPLIALFGVLCGTLGLVWGWGIVAAGLLAVAALTVMSNVLRMRDEAADPGMTTEIAVLVMFGIGVALTRGLTPHAVVAGGGMAVLLHWKDPLHALARRMGPRDFSALMRLVLVGLVILPALPDRSYGPYLVLNPYRIWLVVVLIVGISLAGYVALRLLGRRRGALLAGMLGGLISSTATTVSWARRSREVPTEEATAAAVVALASAVVFGRVLVEIAVVAPEVLVATAAPLAAMAALMLALGGALFLLLGREAGKPGVEHEPPSSELRAALAFGALYALILLAVAVAQDRFGTRGLYAVAIVSGLTDMDAITLSTAQLMRTQDLPVALGWRMILVGALSNIAFKGGIVLALGAPSMKRRIAAAFTTALLAGGAIVALWPG